MMKALRRSRSARSIALASGAVLGMCGITLNAGPASALPLGDCTYQRGTVSQDYSQDNSGISQDISTPVQYVPEQYGAPRGAQIIVSTASVSAYVSRGAAEIRYLTKSPNAINFEVWTQAAGGWPFGHHSGNITVNTTFDWYAYTGC